MKRKIVVLLVLSLVLTAVSAIPVTDTNKVMAALAFQKVSAENGTVTASLLNVRQGPSTNYNVVCVLKKGQSVKICGKLGNWYAIYEPASGCVGAVDSKFISIGGASPKATPKPAAKPAPKATPKPEPKATPVPQATPAPGNVPAPTTGEISDEEQQLLDLINKERANAGLEPLKVDMKLMEVARLKAKDMVDNNYFSHQSPTYGSPFDMMKQFGVEFKTAGENIAGNKTVEGAVKAWMNSEGHRKNILNGKFNHTGIGIVPSPTYGKILVQQFIGK